MSFREARILLLLNAVLVALPIETRHRQTPIMLIPATAKMSGPKETIPEQREYRAATRSLIETRTVTLK